MNQMSGMSFKFIITKHAFEPVHFYLLILKLHDALTFIVHGQNFHPSSFYVLMSNSI